MAQVRSLPRVAQLKDNLKVLQEPLTPLLKTNDDGAKKINEYWLRIIPKEKRPIGEEPKKRADTDLDSRIIPIERREGRTKDQSKE